MYQGFWGIRPLLHKDSNPHLEKFHPAIPSDSPYPDPRGKKKEPIVKNFSILVHSSLNHQQIISPLTFLSAPIHHDPFTPSLRPQTAHHPLSECTYPPDF